MALRLGILRLVGVKEKEGICWVLCLIKQDIIRKYDLFYLFFSLHNLSFKIDKTYDNTKAIIIGYNINIYELSINKSSTFNRHLITRRKQSNKRIQKRKTFPNKDLKNFLLLSKLYPNLIFTIFIHNQTYNNLITTPKIPTLHI